MTLTEARARVEVIRDIADDDEAAHAREDALHQDVLAWIALNANDDSCRELARIALTTLEIRFSRWCA